MPTPLHNGIIPTVGKIERRFVTSGFLTSNELEDHVAHDFGTDVILPSLGLRGKKRTAKKQPDAAFYYIDRSGTSPERDLFPRLVFEVAFSQSYDSVIEDARQWLVRSGGAVQLVVVVKLEEGVHPNAVVDVQEVRKKDREQRDIVRTEGGEIQDSGDSDDDDDTGTSSNYSSEFSTPEGYQRWKTECNPDDWVGPITGFLELYRYNPVSKTAEMDGPRFVSLCTSYVL